MICGCCSGKQAAFYNCHSRARHFYGVFTLPYKKTWGESLHCCAYTLSPADTRLSPQHWLGAAGCHSRAGLVRFTPAQADRTMSSVTEATRWYALHIEPSTFISSRASRAPLP